MVLGSSHSNVSSLIVTEIKPLHVFMHVLATRNVDDDSIKNEQASIFPL